MVDFFAHPESREKFNAETAELAPLGEDVNGAFVATRNMLALEPIAILYCVDGSYVKASPSILKTTNGTDSSAASVQMREMIQNSYKAHLARNKDDAVKPKDFGAAEVTCEVGA
jgi:hypothetical protein